MKLLRAYVITAIACISITALAACIITADETVRRVTLGEESAVVVFDNEPALKKLKEGAKKAASIAPPPINNIYWIAVISERM